MTDDFDSRLAELLARVVPGFVRLASWRQLSAGANQETYALEVETHAGSARYALRRAPGGVEAMHAYGGIGLAREARLIEVARANEVPVPAVLHVLDDGDGLGSGFLMPWLAGETLGARIARDPEFAAIRPQLAFQCGAILARFHAIDVVAHGLDKILEQVAPADFIRQQWRYYQSVATPQPMIDFCARWLLEHLPPSVPPCLVHNDFRNGNLMVSPSHGIVGVLDWEIAHIGDPMRDLGWLLTRSWRFGRPELEVGGFGTRADLFAGYASVNGRLPDPEHVRFWEVFGSFWWAVGTLIMFEQHRAGHAPSVERPAIGRRSSECQIDCVNLLIPGPVEAPTASLPSEAAMPRADEILTAVRDFLRADVVQTSTDRTRFLARVAANSLDIVLREQSLGPALHAAEQARLEQLLRCRGNRTELRWRLVAALRDGSLALDTPGLAAHLRATVFGEVAIDQPHYAGYATALAHA